MKKVKRVSFDSNAEELQRDGWVLEQIIALKKEYVEYEYVLTKDFKD